MDQCSLLRAVVAAAVSWPLHVVLNGSPDSATARHACRLKLALQREARVNVKEIFRLRMDAQEAAKRGAAHRDALENARLQHEASAESARLRTLASEREWISSSPRARQAKSRARISAYEKLLAESQDRTVDSAQIIIPSGERLGDLVI